VSLKSVKKYYKLKFRPEFAQLFCVMSVFVASCAPSSFNLGKVTQLQYTTFTYLAQHEITNFTGAKPDGLQHYFSCPKCAKTHLQASAISKKCSGVIPPESRTPTEKAKGREWGRVGSEKGRGEGEGEGGSSYLAVGRKVGAYDNSNLGLSQNEASKFCEFMKMTMNKDS
jgi:hypothetical protein